MYECINLILIQKNYKQSYLLTKTVVTYFLFWEIVFTCTNENFILVNNNFDLMENRLRSQML